MHGGGLLPEGAPGEHGERAGMATKTLGLADRPACATPDQPGDHIRVQHEHPPRLRRNPGARASGRAEAVAVADDRRNAVRIATLRRRVEGEPRPRQKKANRGRPLSDGGEAIPRTHAAGHSTIPPARAPGSGPTVTWRLAAREALHYPSEKRPGASPRPPGGKEVKTQGVNVRATRKPTLWFRSPESYQKRLAARRSRGT